jgi:hypothetical protein
VGENGVAGGCFSTPSQALGLGQSGIYDDMPTMSGGCGCDLGERRGGLGLGARGAVAGVLIVIAGTRGAEATWPAWAWLGRALVGYALTGSCPRWV